MTELCQAWDNAGKLPCRTEFILRHEVGRFEFAWRFNIVILFCVLPLDPANNPVARTGSNHQDIAMIVRISVTNNQGAIDMMSPPHLSEMTAISILEGID